MAAPIKRRKYGGKKGGAKEGSGQPFVQDQFALVQQPKCHVCQLVDERATIDIMLARGFTVASIHRSLQEKGYDISYRSISRHKDRHLNLEAKALRNIIEQDQAEVFKAEQEGVARIISGKAFLDTFIARAQDKLMDPNFELDAKDGIKAVEVREALLAKKNSQMGEQYEEHMRAIAMAINEIVGQSTGAQILARAKEIIGQAPTQITGGDEEDDDQSVRRGSGEDQPDGSDLDDEVLVEEEHNQQSPRVEPGSNGEVA